MELLTTIVAAEEDEYAAIGESARPLAEWSGIERRGIDTAKIATLHCLLTGDPYEQALSRHEPVYVVEDENVVLRVTDEVLERLQAFDDEAIEQLAEELAASEAFEMEQWATEEVHSLLSELCGLARLAESQGQVLFVWMHPLLD